MKMKRQKTLKAAAALVLCVCIALSGIGTETAFAANKKIPLAVTFNGKTVTLVKNLRSEENYCPALTSALPSLKKKWGTPKKVKDGDDASSTYSTYIWKKGKTELKVHVESYKGKKGEVVSYVEGAIEDKNGSLWGVKVGMKKDTALKKIKKALGTNIIYKTLDDQDQSEVFIVENKKIISANTGVYMPINFELKNGKVTGIYYFC